LGSQRLRESVPFIQEKSWFHPRSARNFSHVSASHSESDELLRRRKMTRLPKAITECPTLRPLIFGWQRLWMTLAASFVLVAGERYA
jgi:hypothetical protein